MSQTLKGIKKISSAFKKKKNSSKTITRKYFPSLKSRDTCCIAYNFPNSALFQRIALWK